MVSIIQIPGAQENSKGDAPPPDLSPLENPISDSILPVEIETAQVHRAVLNARVSIQMVKQFPHHALNTTRTDAHAAPTETQNQTVAGKTVRNVSSKSTISIHYNLYNSIGKNVHIEYLHYMEMT